MILRTFANYSNLIREGRRKKGFTQQELADKIGVTRHWVMRFEKEPWKAELGLFVEALRALDIALKEEDITVKKEDAVGNYFKNLLGKRSE